MRCGLGCVSRLASLPDMRGMCSLVGKTGVPLSWNHGAVLVVHRRLLADCSGVGLIRVPHIARSGVLGEGIGSALLCFKSAICVPRITLGLALPETALLGARCVVVPGRRPERFLASALVY
jgi:hypothetical protein